MSNATINTKWIHESSPLDVQDKRGDSESHHDFINRHLRKARAAMLDFAPDPNTTLTTSWTSSSKLVEVEIEFVNMTGLDVLLAAHAANVEAAMEESPPDEEN